MLEHRVLTQADIDTYPYHGKYSAGPYCKLCSPHIVVRKQDSWGVRYIKKKQQRPIPLKVGASIVKATFRNGSVAYYHETCWNDSEYAGTVANIKTQATGVKNG